MFKDRTGIKYGMLTAIEYLGKSRWLCKCDCGNSTIVHGGHLGDGHTKSCGCLNQNRKPRTNLLNQRFGKLIVIEWAGNGKWLCQCDCGNTVKVQTDNLKNGNTKSCGCLHKEVVSARLTKSLVGKRFGKLIVIEQVENNRYGHICYKCQCDCGGTKIVDSSQLRQGRTNSCGCINSKGETLINDWLQAHNIDFLAQYSFPDVFLSSGRRPRYDFVLVKDGTIVAAIEYNGSQHYYWTGKGWNTEKTYYETIERDRQKIQAMKEKNIPLFIIRYDDNLKQKLQEIVNAVDIEDEEEANT